ncbi:uncharacterized protein [Anabrus simplex]|uniref:uncharacterized protein n=1 Tax=Anabrus simplex TaxID=316456 RepID=UPI0035A33E01
MAHILKGCADFFGLRWTFSQQETVQFILTDDKNTAYLLSKWLYCLGHVAISLHSGDRGHINPAVTLAFALIGRVPCRKICTYFTGQYLGAFIAAFFTYAVYSDAIYNFDSGERQIIGDNATAGIFATFPRDDINKGVLFLDQMECSKEIEEKYKFIEISKQKSIKYINVRNEGKFSREDKFSQQLTIMGSFVLMVVVCAVTDRRNMEVHRSLYALYTGLTFAALGMSLGFNNDFPLNPARDFAPRIFLSVAGYGHAPFTFLLYLSHTTKSAHPFGRAQVFMCPRFLHQWQRQIFRDWFMQCQLNLNSLGEMRYCSPRLPSGLIISPT